MRKTLLAIGGIISILLVSCNQKSFDMNDPSTYPAYDGTDLGVTYSKEVTTFKIWAPTANEMVLRLYNKGVNDEAYEKHTLKKGSNGIWSIGLENDLLGKFYSFQALVNGKWYNEVPGPYAKAVGVNGKRGMVVDLNATNPDNWDKDKRIAINSPSDIVLYEVHVRDFSIHEQSGMKNKGKFLAFTELGTKSAKGNATGIDHLKEMGITHVHLLPSFDYRSIDETRLHEKQYNWGYDPQNFNVPDGSYSTDPYNGAVRINEFKQMVQALHNAGIGVILDVVYNHVGNPDEQSFQQIVPGYYFRFNSDGTFSNSSGCGNETASERAMMRKYIIESVKYWANEYHLDGFRFDLMGIHDITTMNLVAKALHEIDPKIFVYGEGWTAGDSPLPLEQRTVKHNMTNVYGIAAFSDDIRDGIKGHWHDLKTKGFISGAPNMEETIKFGIVASTQHPQVDYKAVNYSDSAWSNSPQQTINYVSCHDNNTLWDKLLISAPEATENDRKRMAKLANTIVMTSQAVPFLHAGVEFLRSKMKVENSFESPDSINWIDWSLKDKNADMVDYYKSLIQMRKEHPAFKMEKTNDIATHLEFMDMEPGVVGYTIANNANGDSWSDIIVVFNANNKAVEFDLGDTWTMALDIEKGYHKNGMEKGGVVKLDPISAYIFYKQ